MCNVWTKIIVDFANCGRLWWVLQLTLSRTSAWEIWLTQRSSGCALEWPVPIPATYIYLEVLPICNYYNFGFRTHFVMLWANYSGFC